jgi:hypothetical protein
VSALSLAILLLAAPAIFAQDAPQSVTIQQAPSAQGGQSSDQGSRPLPLKPAVPGTGRNLRLILKDGSYQLVRDYQIAGDRVRYLSQERGEWEELPADLVDWDATNKWARDHAELAAEDSSPAMKEAADIDKEESEERDDEKARMPIVVPGWSCRTKKACLCWTPFRALPSWWS